MICNPVVVKGGGNTGLETVQGNIKTTAAAVVYYVDSTVTQKVVSYPASPGTRTFSPAKGTVVIVDGSGMFSSVDVTGSVEKITSLGGARITGAAIFMPTGSFTVNVF